MWRIREQTGGLPGLAHVQSERVDVLLELVAIRHLVTRRLVLVMTRRRQPTVGERLSTVELGQALAAHEVHLVRGRIAASESVGVQVS